jgi:hypothetical protein
LPSPMIPSSIFLPSLSGLYAELCKLISELC